jgi:hypothetical protein
MKTTSLFSLLFIVAHSVLAQGTITFGNNLVTLKAPIFGTELDWINFGGDWANAKTGNTPTNTPAGTQVYQGTPVANFLVRFWAAPGVVTDGHLLEQGNVTSTTGSGSLAGYFPTRTVTFANLPASGIATVQVRIYDTSGLLAFGNDASGFVASASALFQANIGSTATGLRSFSIGWLDGATLAPFPVPEPGIGCLATAYMGILAFRKFRLNNS